MFKKIIAVLTAVIASAATLFVLGCGNGNDFLRELDISKLEVISVDSDAETVYAGEADFAAMKATSGDEVLPFRIYVPLKADDGEAVPIFLFLHGAGERGSDNMRQITKYSGLKTLFKDGSPLLDAIVIAPQCPAKYTWMAFDEETEGMSVHATGMYSFETGRPSPALETAVGLVKYYSEKYTIDKRNVIVGGISMGGFGTWDTISRYPEYFTAAAPICGGCDVTKAGNLTNKRIYTFHGALDPIVSPAGTRAMVNKIKELGGNDNIKYTEYADGYHDIWNDAISTDGLADFLVV